MFSICLIHPSYLWFIHLIANSSILSLIHPSYLCLIQSDYLHYMFDWDFSSIPYVWISHVIYGPITHFVITTWEWVEGVMFQLTRWRGSWCTPRGPPSPCSRTPSLACHGSFQSCGPAHGRGSLLHPGGCQSGPGRKKSIFIVCIESAPQFTLY